MWGRIWGPDEASSGRRRGGGRDSQLVPARLDRAALELVPLEGDTGLGARGSWRARDPDRQKRQARVIKKERTTVKKKEKG